MLADTAGVVVLLAFVVVFAGFAAVFVVAALLVVKRHSRHEPHRPMTTTLDSVGARLGLQRFVRPGALGLSEHGIEGGWQGRHIRIVSTEQVHRRRHGVLRSRHHERWPCFRFSAWLPNGSPWGMELASRDLLSGQGIPIPDNQLNTALRLRGSMPPALVGIVMAPEVRTILHNLLHWQHISIDVTGGIVSVELPQKFLAADADVVALMQRTVHLAEAIQQAAISLGATGS